MARTLNDYLDRIEAAVDEGDALLRRPQGHSTRAAVQKCVDAALLIGAYQLYVHRELFDPLARHPDEQVRAAVREIKVEGIALGENLRVAVRGLATGSGEPEPATIAAQARIFNPLVRAHIAKVRDLAGSIGPATAAA